MRLSFWYWRNCCCGRRRRRHRLPCCCRHTVDKLPRTGIEFETSAASPLLLHFGSADHRSSYTPIEREPPQTTLAKPRCSRTLDATRTFNDERRSTSRRRILAQRETYPPTLRTTQWSLEANSSRRHSLAAIAPIINASVVEHRWAHVLALPCSPGRFVSMYIFYGRPTIWEDNRQPIIESARPKELSASARQALIDLIAETLRLTHCPQIQRHRSAHQSGPASLRQRRDFALGLHLLANCRTTIKTDATEIRRLT